MEYTILQNTYTGRWEIHFDQFLEPGVPDYATEEEAQEEVSRLQEEEIQAAIEYENYRAGYDYACGYHD